ncbi:MAG: efflux RND transporter periplasmic adaptor subunit [Cyanobacteria bacterium P01_F01_bin.150]
MDEQSKQPDTAKEAIREDMGGDIGEKFIHHSQNGVLKSNTLSRVTILFILGIVIVLLTPLHRKWLSTLPILSAFQTNQAATAQNSTAQNSSSTTILPVETIKVNSVNAYQVDRSYTGTVFPRRSSALGFEQGGKLLDITVDQGDSVTAGSPLAVLNTKRLNARRQELMAERNQANAQLKELQAGARTETVAAAMATVSNLQSQLDLAQTVRQRRQDLYTVGAISREQLDEAATDVDTLQARLNEAQSRVDELQVGTRPERIEAQQALLQQLDARLASLDIEVQQSTLTAPFSGRVADRFVDEGTVIAAGEPILTLVEDNALEAHIGVPVNAALQVSIGSRLQVQIGSNTYQAQVISTLPQVDAVTRTLTIILRLDPSATEEVRAGQVVRLRLSETISEAGYWLPTTALIKGIRGLWSCYVLGQAEVVDGKDAFRIEQRELEVIHTQGDRVFVRGTLQHHDQVIVSGNHRLVVDQLVRAQ